MECCHGKLKTTIFMKSLTNRHMYVSETRLSTKSFIKITNCELQQEISVKPYLWTYNNKTTYITMMIMKGEKNSDLEQLYNKPNTLKLQYYEVINGQ